MSLPLVLLLRSRHQNCVIVTHLIVLPSLVAVLLTFPVICFWDICFFFCRNHFLAITPVRWPWPCAGVRSCHGDDGDGEGGASRGHGHCARGGDQGFGGGHSETRWVGRNHWSMTFTCWNTKWVQPSVTIGATYLLIHIWKSTALSVPFLSRSGACCPQMRAVWWPLCTGTLAYAFLIQGQLPGTSLLTSFTRFSDCKLCTGIVDWMKLDCHDLPSQLQCVILVSLLIQFWVVSWWIFVKRLNSCQNSCQTLSLLILSCWLKIWTLCYLWELDEIQWFHQGWNFEVPPAGSPLVD